MDTRPVVVKVGQRQWWPSSNALVAHIRFTAWASAGTEVCRETSVTSLPLRDTNGLASRRTGALSTTHATDLMLGIGCHVSPSDPIEGKGRRKRDYESFVGETAPAVDHPATRARLGSGSGHSLGHLPVGAPPGVL
jgi:hypothetical protein